MQVALKCADVSHLAADPVLHHKWAIKLEEEMFRQGDLERAKNMAVSPLMDRHSSAGGITRTQAGAFAWQRLVRALLTAAAFSLTQQHGVASGPHKQMGLRWVWRMPALLQICLSSTARGSTCT